MELHFKERRLSSDPLFKQMWEIYLEAFPDNERRPLDYQKLTMPLEEYHCEGIIDGEELVGLMWWWSLGEVRFIEHFAISSLYRNGGYGARALQEFITREGGVTLLEVEHPECEVSKRRIGFYQRLGFKLNPHHYSHPSYLDDDKQVKLLVMTYPTPISEEWLEQFKRECFPLIHFKNEGVGATD